MEDAMPPQIAILGWGSLLWEGGTEFDRWHDDWRFDGPVLKLEFSRVSSSRLDALTLVVDPEHGVENTVAWCLSRRRDPDDAVSDLRCREGTTLKNVGKLLLAHPEATRQSEHESEQRIATWAGARGLDAVIWTKLASNFNTEVKQPFSVPEALAHLKRLPPAGKARAAEYIWRAPEFIRTPLRSAVQREPWFVEPGGA